jgi:SNF2 family DNA or RNA helicase
VKMSGWWLLTLDGAPVVLRPAAQVVFCKLSPLQLKLYNAFLRSKPVQALLASTAIDPESKAAAAAAAKAKRKSAKVNRAAAAAATQAAAALTQAPAAADGEAGDTGDDTFQQSHTAAGSRRTSASAAAPVSRRGSSSAAAMPITTQQQQQEEAEEVELQQPTAKENTLAPLVAITALKKLCCHPDLIWEMLNKHKVQAKQKAQQQVRLHVVQCQGCTACLWSIAGCCTSVITRGSCYRCHTPCWACLAADVLGVSNFHDESTCSGMLRQS